MRLRRLQWVLAGTALIGARALAQALQGGAVAAPILVHYQERAPYSQTLADGAVQGLVATPTALAFERAGIAFRWMLTPSQRQLALIQHGTAAHCGVGWFRNPSREAVGKFSVALYRDQPLAALVRVGAGWQPGMGFEDALASPSLRLLVKDGYSFGVRVDALIATRAVRKVTTSGEPLQLVSMLLAERADWMLVAPEEAEVILKQSPNHAKQLSLAPLNDMPAGLERHLYCSPAVPDALMARLNAALPPLPKPGRAGARTP
ncbi:hypothetical protein [Rhodoferax sp.]|uniref:hypothetical protein n=1 Tax=Rhodoferax sp. TaxID=50421 RepID=UPI00276D3503|nr:hypothetical protein [Rhodoferax sp.]